MKCKEKTRILSFSKLLSEKQGFVDSKNKNERCIDLFQKKKKKTIVFY
jgi:hypothetical protein